MTVKLRSVAPIGVFDSGLGGLTVAHAIRQALPNEDLVYLGDTARVPYGTRSPSTVLKYARGCAGLLRSHDIKLLVVACNTVSAVALPMLSVELDVPVIGVVGPGARAALRASKGGPIGVIATQGTVSSGAYVKAVCSYDSRAEVVAQPAPLLVPLVEEGWIEGEVPRLAVRRYVRPLVLRGIDVLLLGCTHYPVLGELIRAEVAAMSPDGIAVVDSANATAAELAQVVEERGLAHPGPHEGRLRILVTDLPDHFGEVAERFLGEGSLGVAVEQVDL